MFECVSLYAYQSSKSSTVSSDAQAKAYRWSTVSLYSLCLLRSTCVPVFATEARNLRRLLLPSKLSSMPLRRSQKGAKKLFSTAVT